MGPKIFVTRSGSRYSEGGANHFVEEKRIFQGSTVKRKKAGELRGTCG